MTEWIISNIIFDIASYISVILKSQMISMLLGECDNIPRLHYKPFSFSFPFFTYFDKTFFFFIASLKPLNRLNSITSILET